MDRRIGVLGGAFDPPHIGHRVIARDLVERLRLDRLIVVPTARPPHRSTRIEPERRLRLARRAFAGVPRVEVSDLELRRPGPSYSVYTIETIRADRSPEELLIIMGADQAAVFSSWYAHERIVELATPVVMARADAAPPPARETPRGFVRVDVTRVDLSSTRIRERLARGESVRYLVPESIRADVERWYGGPPPDVGSPEPHREIGATSEPGAPPES